MSPREGRVTPVTSGIPASLRLLTHPLGQTGRRDQLSQTGPDR